MPLAKYNPVNWYLNQFNSNTKSSQNGDAYKVIIYESELKKLTEYVSQYDDVETGGDFFGFWTHSGAPVVHFVIGPGKQSIHNVTSFYQDIDYLSDVHGYLNRKHGLQNIGEWHSHHKLNLNMPSSGDENTLQRGLSHHGWDKFLIMIAAFNIDENRTINQNYFIATKGNNRSAPLRIVVLEGQSPIRMLENGFAELNGEKVNSSISRYKWMPGPYTPKADSSALIEKRWYFDSDFQRCLKSIQDEFAFNSISVKLEATPRNEILLRLNLRDSILIPGKSPLTECIFEFCDEGYEEYKVKVLLKEVSSSKYFELLKHKGDRVEF